jgi:hypothetical protein
VSLPQRQHFSRLGGMVNDAFESGARERGVYFIQKVPANRVVSCSSNKFMFSQIVIIRPGRRLLPVGFQTEHLSRTNVDVGHQGKVLLLTAKDRNVRPVQRRGSVLECSRHKATDRHGPPSCNSNPRAYAVTPKRERDDGWRDLLFWWPVIVTPAQAITSVFASATPGTP